MEIGSVEETAVLLVLQFERFRVGKLDKVPMDGCGGGYLSRSTCLFVHCDKSGVASGTREDAYGKMSARLLGTFGRNEFVLQNNIEE